MAEPAPIIETLLPVKETTPEVWGVKENVLLFRDDGNIKKSKSP